MKFIQGALHWLHLFAPGICVLALCIYTYLSLNLFILPFIIAYTVYILFCLPTQAEIDIWTYIREKVGPLLTTADYSEAFQVKGLLPDKTQPALYTIHPHGLLASSIFVHVLDTHSPLHPVLAHHRIAVHSTLFKIPIFREMLLYHGCIPATRDHMSASLDQSRSVWLVPGGTQEAVHSKTDVETWTFKQHKGFLKMAHQHKVPIVPIYSEGEQTLMTPLYECGWLDSLLSLCTGYTVKAGLIAQACLPHNLLRWHEIGSNLDTKVTTYHIGMPFQVEQIEGASALYEAHVRSLYESVHGKDKELRII